MNFSGFLHHDDDKTSGGETVGGGNNFFSPAAAMSGGPVQFSSPRLSLGLPTNVENKGGEVGRTGESYEVSVTRRSPESRSGSDNVEALSGEDDLDASDRPLKKKKRYHRHTPQQIQELESVFKECPHPDEKQRLDLSRRLNLDTRQVKFWFQNRRTQMKTQIERHENSLLRQENDKLRAENMSVREAMRNPMCGHCGASAVLGEISLEEHQLRIENSRLKDELDRLCALAGKFINRSDDAGSHQLPNSTLKLGVGSRNVDAGGGFTLLHPVFEIPSSHFYSGLNALVNRTGTDIASGGVDEKSLYLELAVSAMDELVKMAQTSEPLWIQSSKGKREMLNREEYDKSFRSCLGPKPDGFVSEASKEVGMVIINSLALVETLMDSERWAEMFPCMIAKNSTIEIISSGMGGTRNGAIHLMQAELQLLSPLVPVRQVTFLRFCKQHAEGVWAVVDVSVDRISERGGSASARSSLSCRRLPSGCLVHDMPNGYAKVTWIDHTEYDETNIHHSYRPLVSSGLAFGSKRWVSALQRQCESLAILMSSAIPNRNKPTPISSIGKKSMLRLAQRMTENFCRGVCASSSHKWSKLDIGNIDEDVRIMTRKNVDDSGEPPGILLSAATSVWVPVTPRRLFDFLRDELLRSEWDILSNGGPMQEIANIFKGQDHSNSVSLLRSTAMNASQSSMLILQETSIDASGAVVVYAPVDIPAMHAVMNGGDSAYVALLPSGFAILPDDQGTEETGSLLTVAFQILVNSLPTAKLNVESIETVSNLISCTVQKIRAALRCDK
ncbi:PREDICTED: homeobox-leucine zipper protein HDG1-like isoform X2 [Brassica oleracea var. oleracea]|uniref:homeobox-leucine zipper protein HDG1-like isoform X2 n=1 Tax=Brassica oleracea var. oleracea TaxID=109376 RepID=UPI0006A742A8|nr:PREDICTED: homeobox-leucine zipper protein HDG1-like isoform X2 [Brassica oleracea var. oleracea]